MERKKLVAAGYPTNDLTRSLPIGQVPSPIRPGPHAQIFDFEAATLLSFMEPVKVQVRRRYDHVPQGGSKYLRVIIGICK